MNADGRVDSERRGTPVELRIDGKPVQGRAGETIGSLLAAIGRRCVRRSPHRHDPRGVYCAMGVCHECLVTVNGRPNVRACVTAIEAGQEITLQDGFGQFTSMIEEAGPAQFVRHRTPLAVIGAGPAGVCAALAAANNGTEVLVIDENPHPGGQIYRQPPGGFVKDPATLFPEYTNGRSLLETVSARSDRITIWNNAVVWSKFEPRQLAIARDDELVLLEAGAIVVATGAYERPVPVAGWTLPGVLTTGGAQVLLKTQAVRPGQRAVLAGTGPLQLVVANQLLDAGVEVLAVAEAATGRGAWRHLPDLLRQPALIRRALGYRRRIRKAGVRLLTGHVLQAIEGDQEVKGVVLTQVDGDGRAIPGRNKSFDVDTVCLGYGFIPQTVIARLLGCAHQYDPTCGAWVPQYDQRMATDRAGVFVAGDCAGVAGVLVAREQGELAGIFAAEQLGRLSTAQAQHQAAAVRQRLKSLRRFRNAMDQMYPYQTGVYAHMREDTIVCRCEEVTAGEIRQAARDGTTDVNDIKKRTRAGMGYCQGANCLPPIMAMLEREFGADPRTASVMTARPPARPLPLNMLLATSKTDA